MGLHYHTRWGECCTFHNNMIKQWHSIRLLWNLMQRSEKDYKQMGVFCLDVYRTTPIYLFNSKVAMPNFAKHKLYNNLYFTMRIKLHKYGHHNV